MCSGDQMEGVPIAFLFFLKTDHNTDTVFPKGQHLAYESYLGVTTPFLAPQPLNIMCSLAWMSTFTMPACSSQ